MERDAVCCPISASSAIRFYFPPGIEKDAVTIFTKYISPDALRPIPVNEQMRNDIVGKIRTTAIEMDGFHSLKVIPHRRYIFSPLPVAKICGEDGMVDPNCFVIAQSVVFAILEQQ